ncbi:hypothetical protein [Tenacibaculum larymnensis]|uniref:Uncharacterized protein n=1 Tax=Tenacibaculum larymnensis TaxID=2878201 RepID=A0A9X4EPI5_9FLAO|nr:hypothetical protein [Tenacibaculum larymnensis]MDE1206973.1 hypothetical protein [Tenacibaculum larymnensis]
MATLNIINTNPNKYGVTEKKKSELDALTNQVLYAQDKVEQLQAIVNSLTEKSQLLQSQLATEKANKDLALSNKELLDQVVDNVIDLLTASHGTFDKVVCSDSRIKDVSNSIKEVMDKLIYSAEVVNKLSNLVIRKKVQNPLISDELVTMVTNAGKDANNAVALTLTALNSVFASQATTVESEGTMSLEYLYAIKLYEFITGENLSEDPVDDTSKKVINIIDKIRLNKRKIIIIEEETTVNEPEKACIKELIYKAYNKASLRYKQVLIASNDAMKQLSEAETALSKETGVLNSLQSGLAAANAAALAS